MSEYYKIDLAGNKVFAESEGFLDIVTVLTDNYNVLVTDSGKTFLIATDDKVISLPATVAGLKIRVINSGAAGNNIVTISPAAADGISGSVVLAAAVTVIAGVVDKDIINTKATAKAGDFVNLIGTGITGTTAWIMDGAVGIWAEEV